MTNALDLSGKLIIKVRLGDDIRRIPIHNEDITYDELVLMMQRVFRGKINSNDELAIKYKDEVNGKPAPLEGDQIKAVRAELQCIRDKVNSLLDELEPVAPGSVQEPPRESSSETSDVAIAPVQVNHIQKAPANPSSKEFDPLSSQKSVEAAQNNVMSSFGISNDVGAGGHPGSPQHQAQQQQQAPSEHQLRAGTPDSQVSVGSSASQKRTPAGLPQGQGQAYAGQGQTAQQGQPQGQPYSGYPQGQYAQQTGAPQNFPQGGAATPYNQQQQQQQPQQAYSQPQAGAAQATPTSQYGGQQQPGAAPGAGGQYAGQPGYQPTSQPQQAQAYPAQQPQPGYTQAGQPGAPGQAPGQSPAQPGYPGYAQPGQPGTANPYSRGPGQQAYGQYPRAHGQYPQAYPPSQ